MSAELGKPTTEGFEQQHVAALNPSTIAVSSANGTDAAEVLPC